MPPQCLQQCWFPTHQTLAYCILATCPRESLLLATCHTGVETRKGLPCRSQPTGMHTKRDMVCACLQEAMLINSTTPTMTWMAPTLTALRGMWALLSAVQFVQTTSQLKWRPSRFFNLNLAKIRRGCRHRNLLHFVHPLQIFENAHWQGGVKGCGKVALAQTPQRWFCAMMLGELWSSIDWSAW